MTCRVLCFALSIKGKTLATFWLLFKLCISRGVCLHTYLGLLRIKIHVESLMIVSVATKSLKKHKWEYLWLLWIKERSSSWTQSCHVVMVVSFLLDVAIGC